MREKRREQIFKARENSSITDSEFTGKITSFI